MFFKSVAQAAQKKKCMYSQKKLTLAYNCMAYNEPMS